MNLSTEEKLRILPLLQNPDGVSIKVMRTYISQRFKDFEMIASALGPARKPASLTALSTSTQDNGEYENEEPPSASEEEEKEEEANHAETEEFEKTSDSKRKPVNPKCLFCQKKGFLDSHWIQNCDLIQPSVK